MEEVKKQGVESLFCPYELALELKELGFDEISLFYYDAAYEGNPLSHCPHLLLNSQLEGFENEPISAPLRQQALRWFREKYKLLSFVDIDSSYRIYCDDIKFDLDIDSRIFKTYEDAELECIKKLIEIAKEQNIK